MVFLTLQNQVKLKDPKWAVNFNLLSFDISVTEKILTYLLSYVDSDKV